MPSIETLLILIVILIIVSIIISFTRHRPNESSKDLKNELMKISIELSRLDPLIRTELQTNRDEQQKIVRDSRDESRTTLHELSESLRKSILELVKSNEEKMDKSISINVEKHRESRDALVGALKGNDERLQLMLQSFNENSKTLNEVLQQISKENRTELTMGLKAFEEKFTSNVKDFNELQRQKFGDLSNKQEQIKADTENKLEKIRSTVEEKLKSIQEDNGRKLEEMRNTVDEKLQSTLEKRFTDSFTMISERLELVHKGLGEMQILANSVGDIKKVMTNVKSRGILGEYQLANILEDLLTNEQYAKNVKTKSNSGAIVEFAIRMPNNNNLEKALWLPIDSKFPKEDYESLVDAYDEGNIQKIDEFKKLFRNAIIKNAKDIKEKYIDPPNTTEYGLMFLPFESLYAEVLRSPGLFEYIQREFKVTVTGPTTLSALLSSLQMGFRTLAIERRSSDVWDLLAVVKTEFGKFGTVLEKTRKKLQEATNTMDQAGIRSRAIERQLRKVQELPSSEALNNLENSIALDGNEIEEEVKNIIIEDDPDQ